MAYPLTTAPDYFRESPPAVGCPKLCAICRVIGIALESEYRCMASIPIARLPVSLPTPRSRETERDTCDNTYSS